MAVAVTMGMARRMTMSVVVLMGVRRGGNHAEDVIL
jgi:hypothetical protein